MNRNRLTPILATALTIATIYHPMFEGRTMANGQRFTHSNPAICAHNGFPLGKRLTVRANGKTLVCVVSDRIAKGAEKRDGEWVVDLTQAGARILRVEGKQTVRVTGIK